MEVEFYIKMNLVYITSSRI